MLVCKLTEARFGAGGHRGAGKLTKIPSRTESNSLGSIMFALKEGVVSQSVLCAGQRSEKKKKGAHLSVGKEAWPAKLTTKIPIAIGAWPGLKMEYSSVSGK